MELSNFRKVLYFQLERNITNFQEFFWNLPYPKPASWSLLIKQEGEHHTQSRFDRSAFKQDHDALYQQYSKTSTRRVLWVGSRSHGQTVHADAATIAERTWTASCDIRSPL